MLRNKLKVFVSRISPPLDTYAWKLLLQNASVLQNQSKEACLLGFVAANQIKALFDNVLNAISGLQ